LWNLTDKSGIGRSKQQDVRTPDYSEESKRVRVIATRIFEPLPTNRQAPFNEAQKLCHFGIEPLFLRGLIGEALRPLE
jgi:hypothetical protein